MQHLKLFFDSAWVRISEYSIIFGNRCLYKWTCILAFASLKLFSFVICIPVLLAWSSVLLAWSSVLLKNFNLLNLNLRILVLFLVFYLLSICDEAMYLPSEDWYYCKFFHFCLIFPSIPIEFNLFHIDSVSQLLMEILQ